MKKDDKKEEKTKVRIPVEDEEVEKVAGGAGDEEIDFDVIEF